MLLYFYLFSSYCYFFSHSFFSNSLFFHYKYLSLSLSCFSSRSFCFCKTFPPCIKSAFIFSYLYLISYYHQSSCYQDIFSFSFYNSICCYHSCLYCSSFCNFFCSFSCMIYYMSFLFYSACCSLSMTCFYRSSYNNQFNILASAFAS